MMNQMRPASAARRLRHAWTGWRRRVTRRADARSARALLPAIVATIPREHRAGVGPARASLVSPGGTSIFELPRATGHDLVVKVASRTGGGANLRRQALVLRALARRVGRSPVAPLIPVPVADGVVEGRRYIVETLLPGRVASRASTERQLAMLPAAAAAIDALHQATAVDTRISERMIRRWLGEPARIIGRRLHDPAARALLEADVRRLSGALLDQPVCVSWIHGDFWLGNVLFDPHGTASGIVDWDSAAASRPGCLDLLHLLATTRRHRIGQPWGTTVAGLMIDGPSEPGEDAVLAAALRSFDGLAPEIAWRLYWLNTVASSLRRHPDVARHRGWLEANVLAILDLSP